MCCVPFSLKKSIKFKFAEFWEILVLALIYANICSFLPIYGQNLWLYKAIFKKFMTVKWPKTIPWTSNFDKYIHLVSTKLYEWKLMVVFLIANLLFNFSSCSYVRRFGIPMHWLGCLFHSKSIKFKFAEFLRILLFVPIYANFCSLFAHLWFFKQFLNEKWPKTIPWTSNFDKYIRLVSTKLYKWKIMVVFLIANLLLNVSPCNYVRPFCIPMHWLGCLFH